MLFHTLLIASAAILTLGATARSSKGEDPKCPEGTYPGFESNVWQFNAPAAEFINKTGSFLHSEWYIGPLNATHGKDNTIGSTRTAAIGTSTFTEELVGYYRSPTLSVLRFLLANGTLPLDGFTLATYTEEMRVMSICGGTATYFSMTAAYCTDKVVNAYDFYNKFHSDTVGTVAQELNALVFTGTCPAAGIYLPQFCLASTSGFQSTDEARDVAYIMEDPKCPQGLYPGFESNVWQFTVPAKAFINRTGSFLHGEWYTGPINSTHGKDNVVGATRTTIADGAVFVDRLMGSSHSATQSVIRFSLANGPVRWQNYVWGSYTEELRAISICGGEATHFTMTATYCVNDVVGGPLFRMWRMS
ncbi:hypothetical protein C0995_007528 [Termitomyces sp. Mi166|nr:hypothetical protein C0995_007528 [Termitomyces sp. Mi166\